MRIDDPVQRAVRRRQLQAPRERSQLKAERFLAQRDEIIHAVPPHGQTPPDMGWVRRHAQYRLNSDMAMFSADSASTPLLSRSSGASRSAARGPHEKNLR